MPKISNDVRSTKLDELKWDQDSVLASLYKIVTHALSHADSIIEWYLKAKRNNALLARVLRIGAIFLTAVAGILPIVHQMCLSADGKPRFASAWASVLLAVAVLLIALDRFFGFSSAWMRYITAQLKIKQLRDSFELEWQATNASFRSQSPNPEQVAAAIGSVKFFLEKVNAVVTEETTKWVAEFQEALKQVDENAKAQAPMNQTGSLTITVTNGDKVDIPGWGIVLDQGASTLYTGKTAAIIGLALGEHVVKVSGKIAVKEVKAEAVITIKPATITTQELTLA